MRWKTKRSFAQEPMVAWPTWTQDDWQIFTLFVAATQPLCDVMLNALLVMKISHCASFTSDAHTNATAECKESTHRERERQRSTCKGQCEILRNKSEALMKAVIIWSVQDDSIGTIQITSAVVMAWDHAWNEWFCPQPFLNIIEFYALWFIWFLSRFIFHLRSFSICVFVCCFDLIFLFFMFFGRRADKPDVTPRWRILEYRNPGWSAGVL